MRTPFARTLALGGLLMLATAALAEAPASLTIGDAAPALKPAKWLKGAPIAEFKKGQVYVVEFWATWCGPCKENIPHLTEMAKKYKGRATIAGISIWESNDPEETGYLQKVETFVKAQGPKMDYVVGVDGPKGVIGDTWMRAAGEAGIPCSFIVGKDGKIAWIGHPAQLESVLDQVLADKFDSESAKKSRANNTRRLIQEAMTAKEYPRALDMIDRAVAAKPETGPMYTYDRLVALFHTDTKAATDLSNSIIKESEGDIGAYRMIVSIFATYKDLDPSVYKFGLTLTAGALEKKEMGYMFLAMQSEIHASLGDKPAAIKSQEEAIKAAEVDTHAPKEFVDMLKKKLEKLKA
ncbi:TlpA family protein disulfide reductase [bacterium]|nr:MAG: TlpA family protein disulfide reductase [bacterium]